MKKNQENKKHLSRNHNVTTFWVVTRLTRSGSVKVEDVLRRNAVWKRILSIQPEVQAQKEHQRGQQQQRGLGLRVARPKDVQRVGWSLCSEAILVVELSQHFRMQRNASRVKLFHLKVSLVSSIPVPQFLCKTLKLVNKLYFFNPQWRLFWHEQSLLTTADPIYPGKSENWPAMEVEQRRALGHSCQDRHLQGKRVFV